MPPQTQEKPSDVHLQLPLMYVAPHRSLSSVYVSAKALDRFEAIRHAVAALGVTPALLYAYHDPAHQHYVGVLVLDQTDTHEAPDQVIAAVSKTSGVTVLGTGERGSGLTACEHSQPTMAGTPVAVVARPFLGNTHKLLLESLGEQASEGLFQAGQDAGTLAASSVLALVATLGLELTPHLIRQRFRDLHVFGWATVVALNVDDRFVGEALLADDFEAGAWQGRATTSVCHWIRGFLSGATSSLAGHALRVSEPECQAKGDPHCRMVFQQA